MFRSHFTDDLQEKLYATRNTVLADYIFTFPAVIIQPLTGFWLIWQSGYDWTSLWLVTTYVLYFIAGICWLPVVWIQIQLKEMILHCIEHDAELPTQYNHYFKLWFILGWPAFVSLIAVFFLMVMKPT